MKAKIGEHNSGSPHSKEAIRKQHINVVPTVPSIVHRLRAHHKRVRRRVRVQKVSGQIDGDDSRGTAHPSQIEAVNVVPQLEMVYDHRRQRRRRVQDSAVHHQDPYVFRIHLRGLEKVLDCPEHHHRCFFSSGV